MQLYEYKGFNIQHYNFSWFAIKDNLIMARSQYRHDLESEINLIIHYESLNQKNNKAIEKYLDDINFGDFKS